jgi:hypothetical protein
LGQPSFRGQPIELRLVVRVEGDPEAIESRFPALPIIPMRISI